MKSLILLSVLCLLTPVVLCQESFMVEGTVRDSLTNEPLIGATVYVLNASAGTTTDTAGVFRLKLETGIHFLRVSYIGYLPDQFNLLIDNDQVVNVFLMPAVTESREIIVTAKNPADNTESSKTGIVELTSRDIGRLPSLMGESDLIRTLQYSPGVQSSGDGNSGFYVRGGNVDQNLILLDNAVVYNPSHVLGLFSVFNSDILSGATLIKSGIPANYGGRLSSVLTVKTIDGNFEKHGLSATMGLIYSKATLQGYLVKNKLSYLVSFRKTYINEIAGPLLNLFANSDSGSVLSESRYGMYDLNLKFSYKPNFRNKLTFMVYKGRDNFNLNKKQIDFNTRIDWGNTLIAFNWNHTISDSTYLTNSLNYSKYEFNYKANQSIMDVDLYSSIRNFNYKLEYNNTTLHMGTVKAGIEAKYYTFIPNNFMLSINDVALNYSSYQDLMAGEFAAFLSVEKDLSDKLRVSGGLRLNNYRQLGPYNQVNRKAGNPEPDTTRFGKLKTVKSYNCLEPRLSVRYQTGEYASVKASYTRNYQFIHVASASAVTMPSDIWIPSTSHTRPQFGDQITLGYYRNFFENNYIASMEAYYKNLANQVELLYGLGASLQDVSFENSLTSGKGYATGLEFYIQKPTGRVTGSLGYSLSYSERQFDEINSGQPFPAKYDRRHETNIAFSYKPGNNWEFSAAFIYATGNAMTVPVQMYWFNSTLNTEYSETNAFRMPPYHRMDVSATYNFRKWGKSESSLNFSIFNVYNRANPFLIYFDIKGDLISDKYLEVSIRQISIFPILPSVSWSFKF